LSEAVVLATPHGVRSCKAGGYWANCHASPDWKQQLAAVRAISSSEDDYRLLKREVSRFVGAAAKGDLTYGKTADVYKMASADLVLELRFNQRVEYPDGSRAVRLYFSEPAHEDDVMLAVLLAAKPATASGLELQNEHISDAQQRLDDHYASE